MANGYKVVKETMSTVASLTLPRASRAGSTKPPGPSDEGQLLEPLVKRGSNRSSVSIPPSFQHEQTAASEWESSQSSLTARLLHKSSIAPPA